MARKNRKNRKKADFMSIAAIAQRAKSYLPPALHPVGGSVCLVIDGMNMAYRAYYARHGLSSRGRSTAIMYGMLQDLKSMLQQFRPNKVVICWDGDKNPHRMKLLPGYKSHREESRDPKQRKKFLKEIERTKKLLYLLGIPQAYNPKVEGDDMVYWIVNKEIRNSRINIISGDKDFCQLINHDTQVYNPRNKQSYSTFAFICDNKVEINQFVDYLCLTGDSSDDIPGYRGIGPVRASQFLQKFRSIKAYLGDEDAEFPGLNDKDKLREIWKRNRMLIDLKKFNLKYHSEKDITYYREKAFPSLREEKFRVYAQRYNLKTFLTKTFIDPFKVLQDA